MRKKVYARVTPEESEHFQKLLFDHGYVWNMGAKTTVRYVNRPVLCIWTEDKTITYVNGGNRDEYATTVLTAVQELNLHKTPDLKTLAIRVKCKSKAEVENVQKLLFAIGCPWSSGSTKVKLLGHPFIVSRGGTFFSLRRCVEGVFNDKAGELIEGSKLKDYLLTLGYTQVLDVEENTDTQPVTPTDQPAQDFQAVSNLNAIQENIMSKPFNFKMQALVDGTPVEDLNDDHLFQTIADAEAEVTRLSSISEGNRPKKLAKRIDDIKAFIGELVKYMDSQD